MGKTVSKKSRPKNLKKKQKINVKLTHVDKKSLARNGNLVETNNYDYTEL